MEVDVLKVLQNPDRRTAGQRQIDQVYFYLLHAPDEPLTDVLVTVRDHFDLGTEEHVIAVQVEDVVYAGRTAVPDVDTVDYDSDVLVDTLDDDRVPISVVYGYLVDSRYARPAPAVETILDFSVFDLR